MDDIAMLKAKLFQSETENARLRGQLYGLISLVKKAWSGDHSAAIDVALIVGVPPPTLEVSSVSDEIVAVPKSRCINNWFRLAVGLINKDYKERHTTAKAQQMLYFRNREAFFDEQMDGSKYSRDTTLGGAEQRASILQDLVESENLKRNELKLKLGTTSPISQTGKRRTSVGSAKQTKSSTSNNDTEMEECLVVQSRPTELSQQQQLPAAADKRPLPEEKHALRVKSAGVTGRNLKAKKTAEKRRPESAHASLGSSQAEQVRCGIKNNNKGRIDDKLNKTESDIALTVQLLQRRLGIDQRGMV